MSVRVGSIRNLVHESQFISLSTMYMYAYYMYVYKVAGCTKCVCVCVCVCVYNYSAIMPLSLVRLLIDTYRLACVWFV